MLVVVVGSSSSGMFDEDVVGFDDDDDPGAKKGTRGIDVVGCFEDGAGTGTSTTAVGLLDEGLDVGLDVGLRFN
jgi:hypothetical protein